MKFFKNLFKKKISLTDQRLMFSLSKEDIQLIESIGFVANHETGYYELSDEKAQKKDFLIFTFGRFYIQQEWYWHAENGNLCTEFNKVYPEKDFETTLIEFLTLQYKK